MFFKKRKYLRKEDRENLRELQRLVNFMQFITDSVAGNTVQLPQGKVEAGKWKTITRLVTERKSMFFAGALKRAGVTPGMNASVDVLTGEITEFPPEPVAEPKTDAESRS